MERCVENTPHTISTFTDGTALLDAAAAGPFGLAVLDIRLQEESGIDVAGKLLQLNPNCYIIFFDGLYGVCAGCLRCGA